MRYRQGWVLRASRQGLMAAVLGTALLAGPAHASALADGSEAKQLPASTLIFVSTAGLDDIWAEAQKTGLWQALLKFPDLKAQLDQGWAQGIAEFEANSGLKFDDVRGLLSGRMSVALTDLDLAAAQKGIPPGIVVTLDLTGHMDQWNAIVVQKALPKIDASFASDKPGSKRTESNWNGSTLHTFSKDGVDIFHAITHKDRFVLATKKPLIEVAFGSASGPTLDGTEHFGWVHKKLDQPALLWAYADIGALWKIVRSFAETQNTMSEDEKRGFKALDALGIDSLAGVGVSSSVVQGGVLDRFALGFNGQPTGLIKVLAETKPGPLGSLKLAPKDALLYSGGNIGNLGRLFAEFHSLMTAIVPPADMAGFDASLAKFKESTGQDLEKDLLAKLSGEVGMMLTLPDIPVALLDNPVVGAMGKLNEIQFALYFGVEDPAAIDTLLQGILEKGKMTSTVEQHNSVSYRLVTIPGSPVFPGYALTGKHLVVGMNTLTLKTAIDLHAGGSGLDSSDGFKKAMSVLNSSGDTVSTSYADVPGLVRTVVRLSTAYLEKAKARGETLPIDPAKIPKPDELAAVIPAIASRSALESDGITGESFSPFGQMTQLMLSSGMSYYQKSQQGSYEPPPDDSSTPSNDGAESAPPSGAEASESGASPGGEPSTAGSGSDSGTSASETPSGETGSTHSESANSLGSGTGSTAPVEPSSPSGTGASSAPATTAGPPQPARTAPPSPQGWSVTNTSGTMATFLAPDFQGNATWIRSALSPYMKLETMVEQLKSSSGSMPDFKVVSEGPLTIGRLSGRELTYEVGEPASRQRMRLIYLQDGTNLYTLTLQCAVTRCDSYQTAFDGIVQSFK